MKKLQIYLIPIAIIIYYYFTKKKVQHLAKVDKKKPLTDKIILDKINLDIYKTYVDISTRDDIKLKNIVLPDFNIEDKIQQYGPAHHGELPLEEIEQWLKDNHETISHIDSPYRQDIVIPDFSVKNKVQQHGELPREDFYFQMNNPSIPFLTGGLKPQPNITSGFNPQTSDVKTNKVKLIKTNHSLSNSKKSDNDYRNSLSDRRESDNDYGKMFY